MAAHAILMELEQAVKDDRRLVLSVIQCQELLAWARDVLESKNDVVRENWRLAAALEKKNEAGSP